MTKDYSAAADWAERDMTLPKNSTSARRGQAAADFGRDLLAKAGGRPPLPEDQRLAATVQVRLTAAEKRELAALAERLGLKPSTVARDALHAYVTEHRVAS
ncbi:MAG: hypothetical protein HHJ14_13565 [Cellulomonas sp.]|uniref:hypothetical protein n=1 Tax=Cellulomonas sp. TaxID=40001 RepID=UPI0017B4E00F|nr:hypothetical protein [Cellulomonas sp.]NMM18100.1 hypothetical protein [Cellulomonas sp.]NMM30804.1 hypothetical protein [Cellulomonas sp.]